MKTLLVIAENSGFAAALQALLNPAEYRLIIRSELENGMLSLSPALVDACLLDAELIDVGPLRIVKRLRDHFTASPILIFTSDKQREWEEEAYLLGVSHVLTKPLRGQLLNHLLDRLWLETPGSLPENSQPVVSTDTQRLDLLTVLPRLFQHGFSAETLLREVILIIREVFKVNRVAIFLRKEDARESAIYSSRAAVGVNEILLRNFELFSSQGIAQQILRTGKIIRASQAGHVARKELDILGMQLAIPISDREQTIGFALIDSQISGREINNEEAHTLFQVLEGIGMALKSIAGHKSIANQEMLFSDTLTQLSCGCVVFDEEMNIVHANAAALALFLPAQQPKELNFKDIPHEIGSRIFTIGKSGKQETFPYKSKDGLAEYVCRLSCFSKSNTRAILLVVDDITHIQKLRQLELETTSLRLIKDMAVHLSHEIGNAIMPVMTSQHLRRNSPEDEKLAKLDCAASNGLKRINRLTRQMQFLADDAIGQRILIPIADLVKEAVEEARSHFDGAEVELEIPNNASSCFELCVERPKLVHAFAEIILNALQASPPGQLAQITWQIPREQKVNSEVCIMIIDRGGGFTPEGARRAVEPFFSTRTVGMGLGLTVAKRIIQAHGGRLEIIADRVAESNIVKIFLQLPTQSESLEQQ